MEIANQIADWLILLIIIVTFILSIHRMDKKQLIPIQLYIFLSIIFNATIKITDTLPQNRLTSDIAHITNNIFSIVEISLIHCFLYLRIKGVWFRNFIILFLLIYLSICGVLWTVRPGSFYSFSPDLFGIECVLIIIPSFFYIYEILRSELIIDLKSDANFIVTCGILFYFGISIPTYFSWYNLHFNVPGFNKILLLSNSIFYGILFISFMKAFLCIIPEQKL